MAENGPSGMVYAASRAGVDLALESNQGVHFRYPKLDLTDSSSIERLAQNIRDEQESVDVLLNVAGLNITRPQTGSRAFPDNKKVIDVNYQGTLEVCMAFLPMMKPGSRIVNLSSVASSLRPYREDLQERFRNTEMTLADLQALVTEYEVWTFFSLKCTNIDQHAGVGESRYCCTRRLARQWLFD